jgi:deazaflavin-dependent oxidoreductase (nitroreductase family)
MTKSYFTPKGKALSWITKTHLSLYRRTGGLLGAALPQLGEPGTGVVVRAMRVLLLTTVGNKSGQKRTVPLPYFEYEGKILVVGSFAGNERHPAWYTNLAVTPAVEVQMGRRRFSARAVPLEGEERTRLWGKLAAEWQRYSVYQSGTERTIPLVALIPDGG